MKTLNACMTVAMASMLLPLAHSQVSKALPEPQPLIVLSPGDGQQQGNAQDTRKGTSAPQATEAPGKPSPSHLRRDHEQALRNGGARPPIAQPLVLLPPSTAPIVNSSVDASVVEATVQEATKDVEKDERVQASSARTVKYHSQDIVPIHTRVRYTTLIQLPENEEVLEAATGDKDFWVVDVVRNFIFVHPAKEGIGSNLNLITNKGNVYSFTLRDVTGTSLPTDLKVLVQPSDSSSLIASNSPVKLVPAAQMNAEVQAAQKAVQAIQEQAAQVIDSYRASYAGKMVLDYSFKRNKSPFFIDAIYHDEKFTYIKVNAQKNQEKFSIYEVRDGKPDLIDYSLKDNVYTITHIVDKGYVRIGKQQMDFAKGK